MPRGIYNHSKTHKLNCQCSCCKMKRKEFMTDSVKQNIGAGSNGKKFSKEHKENISKVLKGQIFSKETIQKMRGNRKEKVTVRTWGWRARKLYEERHGKIPKGFILHHRNEDITDNRDENHKLYPSNVEHNRHHAILQGFGRK